ncbi:MAG: hypothetical protein R3F56_08475 [Planctomycetota bacterium]
MGKLQAGARARRRRAHVDVERESALPADLFECQEPMVEAAVMDAAARVFLDRLGQQPAADLPPPHGLPDAESVDAAAVEACLRHFQQLQEEAPPDLLAGLDDERLWVLVDLARHGTGLGRQRATLELRQLLRRLTEHAGDNRTVLAQLAGGLEAAVREGGFPVVFQALLLEVSGGLRRLDKVPVGERA